ncbi:hypothetical protein P7C70_g3061, partial [Phenoliferia sp. Uapishka_3]
MSFARTAVFYGLSVKARTLVVAAKAHRRLLGPLLALDLISRRISLGTLATTKRNGAQRVPIEVWGLVRRQLYSPALEEASKLWTETMTCGGTNFDVRIEYDFGEHVAIGEVFIWGSGWHTECEACHEAYERKMSEEDMGAGALVKDLLSSFGLVLPLDYHLGLNTSRLQSNVDWLLDDAERCWAISLPLPSSEITTGEVDLLESPAHLIEAQAYENGGSQVSTFAALSPAMFAPAKRSWNCRFETLIDCYELEVSKFFVETAKKDGKEGKAPVRIARGKERPQWRVGTVLTMRLGGVSMLHGGLSTRYSPSNPTLVSLSLAGVQNDIGKTHQHLHSVENETCNGPPADTAIKVLLAIANVTTSSSPSPPQKSLSNLPQNPDRDSLTHPLPLHGPPNLLRSLHPQTPDHSPPP